MRFTAIIEDRSKSERVPSTRAVQVEAPHPEGAAGLAEVIIASEAWERRYPGRGEPYAERTTEADEDWMECMESVATLMIVKGWPQTFDADAIYLPN